MAVPAAENHRISPVGYTDLDDRPAFKIAIQKVGQEWYAYLGHFWHQGWSVVDITDPADPEVVRFVEGPENTMTKQIQVADGKMIAGLERPKKQDPPGGPATDPSKEYATGAYIYDVEDDPTDPQFLGHYETGGRGTHRNFYTGGDYAFMTASPEGYEPTIEDRLTKPVKNFHMRVVDISDPSDPTDVSKFLWPGQHPDDDSEPAYNRYLHGPAYVEGDRAFLSMGRVGMVLLDISDIENPELIYRLGVGEGLGHYQGVHSFVPIPDSNLAAANSEAGHEGSPLNHDEGDPLGYTFIVDISEERPPDWEGTRHVGPRVISSMPLPTPEDHVEFDNYYEKPARFGPHNQHHPRGEDTRLQQNDYLIMTYFNAGIRIFDIQDPTVPFEAGYFVPEKPEKRYGPRPRNELGTQVEDVVVDSRGYIYCSDPNRGLMILETDLF